jgi:hypothetical protein
LDLQFPERTQAGAVNVLHSRQVQNYSEAAGVIDVACVERALLPAAFELDPDPDYVFTSRANCPAEERFSDEAGQFAGKRAGSDGAVAHLTLLCVERALLPAAFDLDPDPDYVFTSRANCPAEERSATKLDSSWVSGWGATEPWHRKERSDDRGHGEGAAAITVYPKQKIRPPGGGHGFKPKANG